MANDQTSNDNKGHSHIENFEEYGVSGLCGANIKPSEEKYGIVGAHSPSLEIIRELTAEKIVIPDSIDPDELRRILLRAMWAEYDAECFCQELDYRVREKGLKLSIPFMEFERLWRRDELDHALGFAKIYSAVYKIPEQTLVEELLKRKGDFSNFESILRDELSIALLIAYDEVATTKSYAKDAVDFYPSFKFPPLIEWIRRLAADEGKHYMNLIMVIRTAHRDRFSEIPKILDEIVELDKKKLPYAGTFALDHDDDQFPPEMLDKCRDRVLHALGIY